MRILLLFFFPMRHPISSCQLRTSVKVQEKVLQEIPDHRKCL